MPGWVLLGAVIAFNVALPLTARAQLLPDRVLADLLGTIAFPEVLRLRLFYPGAMVLGYFLIDVAGYSITV